MIDRIFQTVKAYLNTEGRGNFSPSKFDTILHHVVLDKFEDLFFEVNRQINRQNRGLINGGLENIPDKIREKIQHYLVEDETLTYTAPYFNLPNNVHYLDTVDCNGEPLEFCKNKKQFNAFKTGNPTIEYPIGLKAGYKISIAPSVIVSGVTASYLRTPLQAKWTYQVIDGIEIFNPSANDYVDVDIHPSEEKDIIIKVLQGFGVNLKEEDIQRITQAEIVNEFQQEQTN